jgi:magnesium chelatase family protein
LLSLIHSVALVGTEARLVQVEVDVGGGLPRFCVVGLPTKSVREAEQRTRSAIESSKQAWPQQRIVANLAPGALPKEGTHFDLPIALGIVAGTGRVEPSALRDWMAVGELALDGSLRPVRGTLAAAMACRAARLRGLLCPAGNAAEASLVDGIEVVPARGLPDCIGFLRGEWRPDSVVASPDAAAAPAEDLREVRGQAVAKRALEVAAAGGHNLMLTGPPGSGKTMVARRLVGILPEMSMEESLEVTRIYSVAGLLADGGLIRRRPWRAPHHHVSVAGLVGGGTGLARPGEASLAHASITQCC